MNCRQCGTELVPDMIIEMGKTTETQCMLGGELVWRCPEGCRLNQHETASWQKAMREKPQSQIPKPAL